MRLNRLSSVLCLLLAGSFLCLSGCTKVLNTSDGRQFFKKNKQQITKVSNRVTVDLKNKRAAITFLKNDGADISGSPYTEMKQTADEISALKKEFNTFQTQAKDLIARYDAVVGDKKKIKSDQKVWKKVMKLKKEAEAMRKPVEKLNRKYALLFDKYRSLLRKNNIKSVEVSKVKKVFVDGFQAIGPKAKKAKKRVDAAEKKMTALKMPQHKKAQKRQVLQKMQKQLALIQKEIKQAKEVQQAFMKMTKGKTVVWSGPGTNIGKLEASMKSHINDVNAASAELNQLVKKFNKK
jgi:hypothetical protein